jgi:hypothetical protein
MIAVPVAVAASCVPAHASKQRAINLKNRLKKCILEEKKGTYTCSGVGGSRAAALAAAHAASATPIQTSFSFDMVAVPVAVAASCVPAHASKQREIN